MSTKTKPAAKKAPKLAPIIIKNANREGIAYTAIEDALFTLPKSTLKELLRERGLPMPKDKHSMTLRLADWAIRPGGTFSLTLH